MARENVLIFEKKLMTDEALQKKLFVAAKKYTGDRKDERAVFVSVVFPLAKAAGCEFTFEEAMQVRSDTESEEVSLAEMKTVIGGDGRSAPTQSGYFVGLGGVGKSILDIINANGR